MDVGVVEDVLMQVEVVEALRRQHHADVITCSDDVNCRESCHVTCDGDVTFHYTVSPTTHCVSFLHLLAAAQAVGGVESGPSVQFQNERKTVA